MLVVVVVVLVLLLLTATRRRADDGGRYEFENNPEVRAFLLSAVREPTQRLFSFLHFRARKLYNHHRLHLHLHPPPPTSSSSSSVDAADVVSNSTAGEAGGGSSDAAVDRALAGDDGEAGAALEDGVQQPQVTMRDERRASSVAGLPTVHLGNCVCLVAVVAVIAAAAGCCCCDCCCFSPTTATTLNNDDDDHTDNR